MKIRRLHPEYTIATQMSEDKVRKVVDQGYRSILCNRPDRESREQPDFAQISRAASELGLEAHYLPISLQGARDCDAQAFADLMDHLPRPIFAYCRYGTRCANLWHTYRRGLHQPNQIRTGMAQT